MKKAPATAIDAETHAFFQKALLRSRRRWDRVSAFVLLGEWAAAIVIALWWTPYAWEGRERTVHPHLIYAICFGALLVLPCLLLIHWRPGKAQTRHAVAISQMLWAALFIHLTGGRIETHFHIFASLAFLAFYTDWRVILTATLVVVVDHLSRGLLWPESVYGVANPEWWRFLEHAGWVVFEDVVLIFGVLEKQREMLRSARQFVELRGLSQTFEDRVVERTGELASSREQFRMLVETTKTIPCEIDRDAVRLRYVGPQVESMLGYPPAACLEERFLLEHIHPDDLSHLTESLASLDQSDHADVQIRLRSASDRWLYLRLILSPGDALGAKARAGGSRAIALGVMLDETQQNVMEVQLRQSQKLEAVGRLAAGIAHEINTPVQFVSDSVHFIREADTDLRKILAGYADLRRAVLEHRPAEALARETERLEEEIDLPFVMEKVPAALDRALDGLQRVATIVRSMKEFSHPDQTEKVGLDLNDVVRRTLVIANNECKYVADVQTELADLPSLMGHPGELGQALLNVVVNAAHAIGDLVAGTAQRGTITVRSRVEGGAVVLSVSDTGGGIPEEARAHVFEPFFTTKEVGKGTGQGLAIARSAVVEKHGGELTFESVLGVGTTFFIRIPFQVVEPPASRAA